LALASFSRRIFFLSFFSWSSFVDVVDVADDFSTSSVVAVEGCSGGGNGWECPKGLAVGGDAGAVPDPKGAESEEDTPKGFAKGFADEDEEGGDPNGLAFAAEDAIPKALLALEDAPKPVPKAGFIPAGFVSEVLAPNPEVLAPNPEVLPEDAGAPKGDFSFWLLEPTEPNPPKPPEFDFDPSVPPVPFSLAFATLKGLLLAVELAVLLPPPKVAPNVAAFEIGFLLESMLELLPSPAPPIPPPPPNPPNPPPALLVPKGACSLLPPPPNADAPALPPPPNPPCDPNPPVALLPAPPPKADPPP